MTPRAATPADRRLLPEGRMAGPMPWVIAIMMFLTALAAAGGLALDAAAREVTAGMAQRVTVQIVEANPDLRERQARAVVARLETLGGVTQVTRVPDAEIAALLEPWLGAGAIEEGIPVPAMIDVDLTEAAHARLEAIGAIVRRIAPSARIDDHAAFLAPLASLIGALKWLALGLVLLTAGATAATVVLAARSALNTHRATIDVLHLMGSTDVQIARLFQRRIALDALFGGAVGLVIAVAVVVVLGNRIGAVGSELVGSVRLPWTGWIVLALLPIGGALVATLVARVTVLTALRKML